LFVYKDKKRKSEGERRATGPQRDEDMGGAGMGDRGTE